MNNETIMTIIVSNNENTEEIPKLCDWYCSFWSYIFHIQFELSGHLESRRVDVYFLAFNCLRLGSLNIQAKSLLDGETYPTNMFKWFYLQANMKNNSTITLRAKPFSIYMLKWL